MKSCIPCLFFLLLSAVANQDAACGDQWIDKPQIQWPQIAMINDIQYEQKRHPVAGCGFLLDSGKGVYAVTAKHVLTYFKSESMDSVHFRGTLVSWKMYPKNSPKDMVVVDRLVNEDAGESIEKILPKRDWLIFSVKERSKNIQPLKCRKSALIPGEKVYIVGWRYSDKECTQRIYDGKFVKMQDGSFLISCTELADNTIPGLSGAPVIDSSGDLIGIMCQKTGKMERPSSLDYPRKVLKIGSAVMSEELETATFGAGCFWCVEAIFQEVEGVRSVMSGYAGGALKDPTYEQICSGTTGHAEVVQITFDPGVVSFEDLLDVFWRTHDPTTLNRQGADVGDQYRSIVFYHTEKQKAAAEKSKSKTEESGLWPDPIVTEIAPFKKFYKAEAYHQNYYRSNPNKPYCRMVIEPKLRKF